VLFQKPPVLVLITASAIAGIVLDRCFDPHLVIWLGLPFVAFGLWLLGRKSRRLSKSLAGAKLLHRPSVAGGLVLIAWLATGGLWHHVWWNVYPESEIGRYSTVTGSPVAIKVRLAGEPKLIEGPSSSPLSPLANEPRYKFSAAALAIRDGPNWQPVSGQVDVFVRGVFDIATGGDIAEIFGELKSMESPSNPGEFNFREYSRGERKLVWVVVRSPDAVRITSSWQSVNASLRARIRRHLGNVIENYVPDSQVAAASAILLGNRSLISPDDRQQYLMTGTVHILAISGLHIGIMSAGLFLLLRLGLLPRRTCLVLVVLAVGFYAWTVEFTTPVTRASILIALFCLSRIIGRYGRSSTLLSAAAVLIIALSPSSVFSAGTQLSFLAVGVLVWENRRTPGKRIVDPLQTLILQTRSWPEKMLRAIGLAVRRTIRVSSLIWLFAMPLVALRFHLFSPIGLVVNPLVIFPMSSALYGGLIVMIFGGWLAPVAAIGGWICGWSLATISWLVSVSAAYPGGCTWVIGPTVLSVCIYYSFLGWLAGKDKQKFRLPVPLAMTFVWLVLGWTVPEAVSRMIRNSGSPALEVTFADVGHGSSAIVRLPDGRHLLFDAGSYGSVDRGLRAVSSCLWTAGVDHIDAIVISHADTDHFNSVPSLCEQFSVGKVWISPQMLSRGGEAGSASVRFLLENLARLRIPVGLLFAGCELDCGPDVVCEAIAPQEASFSGNDNSDSIVLFVSFRNQSLLLTGDIEPPGMEQLQVLKGFPVSVASAPHHGSMGSDPPRFCDLARPQLVVISADRDRLSPASLETYRSRVPMVISTGDTGAIRMRLDSEGFRWKTWLGCGRSMAKWNSNGNWSRPTSATILRPTGIRDD